MSSLVNLTLSTLTIPAGAKVGDVVAIISGMSPPINNGGGTPSNALTLAGQPITLGNALVTLGA